MKRKPWAALSPLRGLRFRGVLAGALLTIGAPLGAAPPPQVFVVEDLNDDEYIAAPPPPPVHPVTHELSVGRSGHVETIPLSSRRYRNLSVTLTNTGLGVIRAPYVYGPHGWDYRSLERIASAATQGAATPLEKFARLHEWKGMHVQHVLGGSYAPYDDPRFSGNPLRVLNQYGHGMCGQSTDTMNAILAAAPPLGSILGRKVKVGEHRPGEAFFDGAWHAYDATPGTGGVVQWLYYDEDNTMLAPSWKALIARPGLVSRIKTWTGFAPTRYLTDATGETLAVKREFPHWDFNYDLRPGESLTMRFEMNGRLDRVSARQDNSQIYRCYSDYGSAVFTYRPKLTSPSHRKHIVKLQNVAFAADGLVPLDPGTKSYAIFGARSTWCFAGSTIRAGFKTTGKVSLAVHADPFDTEYSEELSWQPLSTGRREYESASIEGKMAYWVKVEFQGAGSGLSSFEMASEVQMSPWSMPGLEYGANRIRVEAQDFGGGTLRVVFRGDDASSFHSYEPATSRRGRHIPIRIGGVLQQGAKRDTFNYGKGRFWKLLHDAPGARVRARVEIYQVSGRNAGRLVRTLVDRELPYGWYTFYWNGADDAGKALPTGMYAYRLSLGGKVVHGERLYLYPEIWPLPNEQAAPAEPAEPDEPDLQPGQVLPGGRFLGEAPLPARDPAPVEDDLGRGAALLPLDVARLRGHVRFDVPRPATGRQPDHLVLHGVLPELPAGWSPEGVELRVDVGGAEVAMTLDARGRARTANASLRLELRRRHGTFRGGRIPFRLRLAGDWAHQWADEGVHGDGDEAGAPIALQVSAELDGARRVAEIPASLQAAEGRWARIRFRR